MDKQCEYYWFTLDELPQNDEPLAWTQHHCQDPGTVTVERTGSALPDHNGPMWVCQGHLGEVELQNRVNGLLYARPTAPCAPGQTPDGDLVCQRHGSWGCVSVPGPLEEEA